MRPEASRRWRAISRAAASFRFEVDRLLWQQGWQVTHVR
jgi:hypothetical protein